MSLADEIRVVAEQVDQFARRKRPVPRPDDVVKRIQDDMDELARRFEAAQANDVANEAPPEPRPTEDRAERLRRILQLVVAEL